MSYTPTYTGQDSAVSTEFWRLSQVLQEFAAQMYEPSYKPPDKPRKGMVRYADGSSWNPGAGEGLYVYSGSFWVLLGAAGFGTTVTLYVDPAGDDNDDGSVNGPFETIQKAVDVFSQSFAITRGSCVINLAEGDYAGAIVTRKFITGNNLELFTIKGPDVGGYPNEPTARILQSLNTSRNAGLSFGWNQQIIVQDIKTEGFSATNKSGISASRKCDIRLHNVHDEGSYFGGEFVNNVTYTWDGGILTDNVHSGIEELFQVVRDITADKVLIVNPGEAGLFAKEGVYGHVDSLEVDGAGVTGLEFHSGGSANLGGVTLKNCPIGITASNFEIHEESGIVWGTGADACTRKFNFGPAVTMLSRTGWVGTPASYRSGSREPELRGHDYATYLIEDTANHDFNLGTIYANEHALEGQKVIVLVEGKRVIGSNDTASINLRLGGVNVGVSILSISGANATFWVRFEVLCYADGDFQRVIVRGQVEESALAVQIANRTENWSAVDKSVVVRAVQANASDKLEILVQRFWA